jgi:hypothetical protein
MLANGGRGGRFIGGLAIVCFVMEGLLAWLGELLALRGSPIEAFTGGGTLPGKATEWLGWTAFGGKLMPFGIEWLEAISVETAPLTGDCIKGCAGAALPAIIETALPNGAALKGGGTTPPCWVPLKNPTLNGAEFFGPACALPEVAFQSAGVLTAASFAGGCPGKTPSAGRFMIDV